MVLSRYKQCSITNHLRLLKMPIDHLVPMSKCPKSIVLGKQECVLGTALNSTTKSCPPVGFLKCKYSWVSLLVFDATITGTLQVPPGRIDTFNYYKIVLNIRPSMKMYLVFLFFFRKLFCEHSSTYSKYNFKMIFTRNGVLTMYRRTTEQIENY